eukprot:916584-Prymnesium_polylepis.1
MAGVVGGPSHAPGRPANSFLKTGTRVMTTGGSTTKSGAATPCTILLPGGAGGRVAAVLLPAPRPLPD